MSRPFALELLASDPDNHGARSPCMRNLRLIGSRRHPQSCICSAGAIVVCFSVRHWPGSEREHSSPSMASPSASL